MPKTGANFHLRRPAHQVQAFLNLVMTATQVGPFSVFGRLFALLLGFAMTLNGLQAGDEPWLKLEPAAWTLEDAESVLWKSPWAKVKVVPFFDRNGNRREARFCVRIQSALPIRIAMAQSFQLQPEDFVYRPAKLNHEKTMELASQIALKGEMVLSVIVFPPLFHRRLNEEDPAAVQKATQMLVDHQRIPLKKFVAPKDSSFGEAWFRFPRPELKKGQTVRFSTEIHTPRRMKVEVLFETSELFFEGKLSY
jgi:hypothetical protein